MSKSYSRTSSPPSGLLPFALAGLLLLPATSRAAKSKPDAAAAAAAEEESTDPCLLDGLCRAHYLRARNLSRDGNFEGALAAYEAAYRRRSVPWLLISIGRTLHKLGRPGEALKQYERYRQDDKSPNPARLERVTEYAKQAEADLAAAPKPVPATPVNPPSSDPTGGSATGSNPTPGSEPGKNPPGGENPAPISKPAATVVRPAPLSEPMPAPPPPRWKWNGLWIGLGISGGFLLLGGALGIAAQASSSQLRGTTYVGGNPSADVVALQNRIRGLAVAADTFFVATAVSVGVTLALTFTRKPVAARPISRPLPGLEDVDSPPPASSAVAPSPAAATKPQPTVAPSAPAQTEPAAPAPIEPSAAPKPEAPSAPPAPTTGAPVGASGSPGASPSPGPVTPATVAPPPVAPATAAPPSVAPAAPASPSAVPSAPSSPAGSASPALDGKPVPPSPPPTAGAP